ncbi:MAG: heparan-alpha-glucosaminide N-acetyltransferase domain-containing protein [Ignavibacteriales bacterium]|nr:heparan-alpha-glucosaminide N-acetyltransferase domain-containing protein [Ignavibacteriales bacterium]
MEKKRLLFIDLLRGWALLVMIEVHVFNAMLQPTIRASGWWSILNFINGLVAPSFLFISGFAFMIASQRKLNDFKKFKFDFWRQIGRIFLIWGVGYSLHIPFLSLQKIKAEATPELMRQFYAVDVLQCIVFGLLMMFLLRLIIKKEKIYNIIISSLAFVFAGVAPFVDKIDFTQWMPLPIADYFNSVHGSLFPLFPWLGFMLAGGVMSSIYMKVKNENREEKFLKKYLWGGVAATVIGIVVLTIDPIPNLKPHPSFFLERLGIVVLLLIGLRYYEKWRNTHKSFVLDVGRESLLVYWLHLQVIYRKIWNGRSLEEIINNHLNVLEAFSATILLAILMIVTAIIWGKFKKIFKKEAQVVVVSTVLIVILWLLVK